MSFEYYLYMSLAIVSFLMTYVFLFSRNRFPTFFSTIPVWLFLTATILYLIAMNKSYIDPCIRYETVGAYNQKICMEVNPNK
jgi:hypothetical protein